MQSKSILASRDHPESDDNQERRNLSSIARQVGSVNSALYTMTKCGVRLFTKATAIEVAHLGYNIRSNSVHPGVVDTDMGCGVPGSLKVLGVPQAQGDPMLAFMQPLGRLARATEIARENRPEKARAEGPLPDLETF